MDKIKGLCFGNGCVCTMFGTFWGSAPTRCHHRCQGTHGNAPALPALTGIMPMFKMNQASMHGAAQRLASKASWFKPLPLWGSEQNTNMSQNDLCEMLPRALQLRSNSVPHGAKRRKMRWGKKGVRAAFPPAAHTVLLRLTLEAGTAACIEQPAC